METSTTVKKNNNKKIINKKRHMPKLIQRLQTVRCYESSGRWPRVSDVTGITGRGKAGIDGPHV